MQKLACKYDTGIKFDIVGFVVHSIYKIDAHQLYIFSLDLCLRSCGSTPASLSIALNCGVARWESKLIADKDVDR